MKLPRAPRPDRCRGLLTRRGGRSLGAALVAGTCLFAPGAARAGLDGPPRWPDSAGETEGPPLRRNRPSVRAAEDRAAGAENAFLSGGDGTRRVNQDASQEDQNETTIALGSADPAHPDVPRSMTVAWNDYFTGDGRNTVVGTGWSEDGGASWNSSRYSPATFSGVSTGDPALANDGHGHLVLALLAYGGTPRDGIWTAVSLDGGRSFAEPRQMDTAGDKPFVVAEPVTGVLYLFWQNTGAGSPQAIWFSKSVDGGATWSLRREISDREWRSQNGAIPCVGPGGEIFVLWSDETNRRILFDRSLDGGASFTTPEIVVAPRPTPVSPTNM